MRRGAPLLSIALAIVALAACNRSDDTASAKTAPSGPQWAMVRNDLVEDYLKAHPAFAVVAGRHEYDGVIAEELRRVLKACHA